MVGPPQSHVAGVSFLSPLDLGQHAPAMLAAARCALASERCVETTPAPVHGELWTVYTIPPPHQAQDLRRHRAVRRVLVLAG